MYTSTIALNNTHPTAHVSINRNRVKQYNGSPTKVYLKDNQEFEIELFNPKTMPVMAKIKLNGEYISTKGIYLKPGQRIFLNRFIDSAQKFKFSTYQIDAADSTAVNAIVKNGDLTVEFYDETIKFVAQQPYWLTGGCVPTLDVFSTQCFTNTVNTYVSNASSNVGFNKKLRSTSLDTGRVEAGATSNQKFQDTYGDFNNFYSSAISYKLLPDTHEPVTIQQIVSTTANNFCGACGNKITKSNYKFCPNCGEKL